MDYIIFDSKEDSQHTPSSLIAPCLLRAISWLQKKSAGKSEFNTGWNSVACTGVQLMATICNKLDAWLDGKSIKIMRESLKIQNVKMCSCA